VQLQLALFRLTFAHPEMAHVIAAAASPPRGCAIQARVSLERVVDPRTITLAASGGCISLFDLPSGPGVSRSPCCCPHPAAHASPEHQQLRRLPLTRVCPAQVRVDCTGYVGYSPNPSFDSLVAKVIVHAPVWADAVQLLRRALAEVRIVGVSSNVGFLQALAATREFETNDVTTTFIEENMARLCDPQAPGVQPELSAATVNQSLSSHQQQPQPQPQLPEGSVALTSPIRGRVSRLAVQVQGQIAAGACLCVRPLHLPAKSLSHACHALLLQVRT